MRLGRCAWLYAVAVLGWASIAHADGVPPRIWVEAELDRPVVPVNAQATVVVRLGYAIDVQSPSIELVGARLSEVTPVEPEIVREVWRQGTRYRVRERAYAVVPFASGVQQLRAKASGRTPASFPGARVGGGFEVEAAPVVLQVTGAVAGANWLPAYNLQISGSPAARSDLDGNDGPRVGDVLERRVRVEAEGVDGSVIPALAWPRSADFSIRHDAARVGTRIAGRRLVGWREESVRLQPLRSGSLIVPKIGISWWSIPAGQWIETSVPEEHIEVRAGDAKGTRAVGESAPNRGGAFAMAAAVAAALTLLAVVSVRRFRLAIVRAWQRRAFRRELRSASRSGDADRARRALLGSADLPTLESCCERAGAIGNTALAREISRLEAACYGRSTDGRATWRSEVLGRRSWRL